MNAESPAAPAVNIIILNWNGRQDTMKSVASSLAQTYANVEVTLVDNGSTDDSVTVFRSIEDPRVRIVESGRNLGFAGGVNLGLEHALRRAPGYVLLLNNDATMAPDAVSAFVAYMEAHPGVGIAGGVVLNEHDDQVQVFGGGHVHPLTGSCRRRNNAGDPDFISGALMFIREAALRDVQRLSDDYFMYWEDVAFSRRVVAAGWKLGVCEGAKARHKAMASIGANSIGYDYHFTRSATIFFVHERGAAGLLPLGVIVAKKLAKRVVFGPRRNLAAVASGVLHGLRKKHA